MNLNGEVALVTGASRGIGRAILQALGQQGATVIGTATSEKGATEIDAAVQEAGMHGAGKVLDVCDPDSVNTLIKTIAKEFGAVSILINNAGITRDNLLMRVSDDDWQAVIDTNLNAVARVARGCLRGMMKARHGRIINIASVVAEMGNPGQANYAAAKAGMLGLTRSLAHEVGSRGITVNSVAPGFIDTDMTRALADETRADLLGRIPLGRFGQPEEVAQACVFLASAAGGYITGHTLDVNGGLHMS